jgi:hypothetical protein
MNTSTNKRSWWTSPMGLLLVLGLLSSAVAWWMIAWPIASFANQAKHNGHFLRLYPHMLGGTIMLFFGAANLYIGASRQHFKYHKFIGRVYLIGGSLGAIAALSINLTTAHKSDAAGIFTNSTLSTATLALAWLGSAAMAYRAVRNKRYDSHRDWIIRSYVLAWSFVFCRLASRVPGINELGGGHAFIWLSWVTPFIICEFALQWRAGANRSLDRNGGKRLSHQA